MAGEWIKVERVTPDKPEVIKIARVLGIDRDTVFGKLIRLWFWFDQNSVDGHVDGVVSQEVDELVGCCGFSNSLSDVGWLDFDDENEWVEIPNFSTHNGQTAKQRASKGKRQQKYRENKRKSVDAPPSTKPSLEKRREEKNKERGKFTPPTLSEVKNYIDEKGYFFTAESFISFYTSKNWHIGKNKMVCWKSACATWHGRDIQTGINAGVQQGDFEVPGI